MVNSRDLGPIVSMDLANMRANGVRCLDVSCNQCRHHQTVWNVDNLPGDVKIVCARRALMHTDVRPNWKERQR